jgi:hypothetical protein
LPLAARCGLRLIGWKNDNGSGAVITSDANGTVTVTLGDPNAKDIGEGCIVAVDFMVLEWLAQRRRVLARMKKKREGHPSRNFQPDTPADDRTS